MANFYLELKLAIFSSIEIKEVLRKNSRYTTYYSLGIIFPLTLNLSSLFLLNSLRSPAKLTFHFMLPHCRHMR